MPTTDPALEALLDAAERLIRERGWPGLTVRAAARLARMGETRARRLGGDRAALAVAVMRRETDRVLAALGDPNDGRRAVTRLCDAWREAARLKAWRLAAQLSAARDQAPAAVGEAAEAFYDRVWTWTARAVAASAEGRLSAQEVDRRAMSIVCLLEGAALISRACDETAIFDQAAIAIGV